MESRRVGCGDGLCVCEGEWGGGRCGEQLSDWAQRARLRQLCVCVGDAVSS